MLESVDVSIIQVQLMFTFVSWPWRLLFIVPFFLSIARGDDINTTHTTNEQYDVAKIESARPLADSMNKSDGARFYEFDFYALSPSEKEGTISIAVTPIHWEHRDHKEVVISVSTTNPLSTDFNASSAPWDVIDGSVSGASNTVHIDEETAARLVNATLWIAVELSAEYRQSADHALFEFTVMAFTAQTVHLPMGSTLVRGVGAGAAVSFEVAVEVGRDFTVFIDSMSNGTCTLLLDNRFSDDAVPNIEDPDSWRWRADIDESNAFLSQIVLNANDEGSCQSIDAADSGSTSNSTTTVGNAPSIETAAEFQCLYWITVYNPTEFEMEFAILGSTEFYRMSNGEAVTAPITTDGESQRRFVLDPGLFALRRNESYLLLVSAAVVIGDAMGLLIGSTPFDDDLYSELDGRGRVFFKENIS